MTSNAWRKRAPELADWAMRLLVNRVDVWGGYRPPEEWDKTFTNLDGSTGKLGRQTTRPAPSKRGKVYMSREVLVRHFFGVSVGDIIGVHTTSADNTSRWGSVELDVHGSGGNNPVSTTRAAMAWFAKLQSLGFRPLLSDSNGAGGFHLDTIFREPAATPVVFSFLRWLSSDFDKYGLTTQPETFPKQATIDAGRIGNWLRVIGRHHTRDHWSRIWNGSTWLDGAEAVDFVLSITGDDSALIPTEARTFIRPRALIPQTTRPAAPVSVDHLDRWTPS